MNQKDLLLQLRTPDSQSPLRILMSACLSGVKCGYDGSSNGTYPSALKLLEYDTVKMIPFCPEEFSFGSPREMCDIHGGNGFDVLDGKAKLLSESGKDWSEGIIRASERMLEIALQEKAELAVMMDISAACGSTVIYDGNRFDAQKKYQQGAGVCAAQLMRHGILVISQRDYASLDILYSKIDPTHQMNAELLDHRETEWYKTYFQK